MTTDATWDAREDRRLDLAEREIAVKERGFEVAVETEQSRVAALTAIEEERTAILKADAKVREDAEARRIEWHTEAVTRRDQENERFEFWNEKADAINEKACALLERIAVACEAQSK